MVDYSNTADLNNILNISIGEVKSMLPAKYRKVNIKSSDLTEKEKEILKDVVKNKVSLLLTGKAGTGKTHFAALVYNYSNINKAWFDVNEYILELQKRKWLKTTDAAEYLQSWWDIALTTSLVVLDDLGAEENTEETQGIVRRILMHRYNYEKQTIITTNLSGEQLKERYSERIVSRIYEDYLVYIMNGKDRRKEKLVMRICDDA